MEKWDFLRPFWATLRLHGAELMPARLPGSLQYFLKGFQQVIYNQRRREVVPFVRDALELVALLALADRRAFMVMARETLPLVGAFQNRAPVFHPDVFFAPLTLRIVLYGDNVGDFEWTIIDLSGQILSELLLPVELQKRDASFQQARDRIIRSMGDKRKKPNGPVEAEALHKSCEQLTICLDIALCHKQVTRAMLDEVVRVKRSAEDTRHNVRGCDVYAYHMGHVDLQVNGRSFTEADLFALEEHFSTGLLTLGDRQVACAYANGSAALLARTLLALAPFGGDPSVHNGDGDGDEAAALRARNSSFRAQVNYNGTAFDQLCSALMGCQDIQSLDLRLGLRNNQIGLQPLHLVWLVHTLFFSTSTCHRIHHLVLPLFDMADDALHVLTQYALEKFRSRNPAAFLFDQKTWGKIDITHELERQPKCVCLANGTLVELSPPQTTEGNNDSAPLPVSMDCEVLYESQDGHVHVLVPGYGHCRVAKKDVVVEEIEASALTETSSRPHSHATSSGIKSLTINTRTHTSRFQPNFISFLSIFSHNLEVITIESYFEDTSLLLDALWTTACPNLKRIRLFQCRINDFAFFVDAYESGKRRQVTSLEFTKTQLTASNFESLLALFHALADPSTTIFATLRELCLDFVRVAADKCDALTLAMTQMLAVNRTLRFVSLSAQADTPLIQCAPLIMCFDGKWVRELLPMRSKCAFLSVVAAAAAVVTEQPTNAQNNIAAMARFDSFVLGVIFEMAATPVKRHVVVRACIPAIRHQY